MDVTYEQLHEIFEYSKDAGTLRHKIRPRHWFSADMYWKSWNSRFSGKLVYNPSLGGTERYKTLHVIINRKHYLAHRVIWKMMTGENPPAQIDHINGNPYDNRWKNLRDGTKLNHYNRARNVNNTTGHPGVYWHSRDEKYFVVIRYKGKRYNLGYHKNLNDAKRVAEEFRKCRPEYTHRHGKHSIDVVK